MVAAGQAGDKPVFYPDDPVCCAIKPKPVGDLKSRSTDALYDFVYNSFAPVKQPVRASRGINTLGEVVDSEWYTNRHGRKRMTLDELRRGPGEGHPPQPPFTVVGAKLDGITPGFRMRDAKGELYFVKPDPMSAPEMATAADVIGARFFYALGYNTPENYILLLGPKETTMATKGEITGANGKPRPMTARDVEKVLWKVPKTADGKYRLVASRAVAGKPIGAFRYLGTRSDDPNDLIPHEDRRDLRGLYVFCAWLNHTDAKAGNSMDTLVEVGGVRFVRHYLIDFGAILGSDSDMPKNARFGNEYIFPEKNQAFKDMAGMGLNAKDWEKAKTPKIRGVGRFQAESFHPEAWTSNYPNPAFLRRQPDDEYWAAKQVMAFTDEDIRAIVETGQYSDARATEYITKTLIQRRDKIGRTFFTKVLALDHFRTAGGMLAFDDLGAERNYYPPRNYRIAWSRFDPLANKATPIEGASGFSIPEGAPGTYLEAVLSEPSQGARTVKVYLRLKGGEPPQVVGIQRTW